MNFDVMVTLVTFGAWTSTSYTIRTFNSLHYGALFGIFEYTVDFFFCKQSSDLCIICTYKG